VREISFTEGLFEQLENIRVELEQINNRLIAGEDVGVYTPTYSSLEEMARQILGVKDGV
jgi:hypothetical protein